MADNNPLFHPEEVLAAQVLVAESPLDSKIIRPTLVARDAIPSIQRYHMMKVDVQENSTSYILNNPLNLTNTGWSKRIGRGIYHGEFDPSNAPVLPPKDNDPANFTANDWYSISEDGFWNFTTGDQTPDTGSDHVVNLVKGDSIEYDLNDTWVVIPNRDLVKSVNGKQDIVILLAADIDIAPIVGMSATETQSALAELKNITDGIAGGAVYLGSFDPNTPGPNPPTDGDIINFNQGDFGVVSVDGFWNFTTGDQTPDGGGDHVANLVVGDEIRFNSIAVWDIIPNVTATPGGADENIQYNDSGVFQGNSLFKWNKASAWVEIWHSSLNWRTEVRPSAIVMFAPGTAGVTVQLSSANAGNLTLKDDNNSNSFISLNASEANGGTVNFNLTGQIHVSRGTTAQRASIPAEGMFRFNLDTSKFEGYDGTLWGNIGGGEPAGADREIQFNNGGAFGASSNFKLASDSLLVSTNSAHTAPPLWSIISGDDNNTIGIGTGVLAWSQMFGDVHTFDNGGTNRSLANSMIVGTGNTARIANGAFGIFSSLMWGSANLIEPANAGNYVYTNIGGASNISRHNYQSISGANGDYAGLGAFAHGFGDVTKKLTIGGEWGILLSSNTAAQTVGHGVLANNAAIIGGVDHNIPADSHRSVIIGGNLIKGDATTPDTVFMPKLRIGRGSGAAIVQDDAVDRLAVIDAVTGEIKWRDPLTVGQVFGSQTINHSVEGALDIDFSLGSFAIVNLTANITSLTISSANGLSQILFVQDATGGRSVDFTGIKTIDGAIPDYSTVSDAESLMTVTKANSSIYMTGAGNMTEI